MRPVGYGAMLAEGFVAFISLVTLVILGTGDLRGMSPATICGNAIGHSLALIGREYLPFAMTFGAMAFSTFVFDTLDVGTRRGRYIMQELFGWKGRLGAFSDTLITVALSGVFVLLSLEGGWRNFWTLFGTANQLLAGLTLLSVTAWLHKARRRIAFTLVPMLFVLTITLWALARLAMVNLSAGSGIAIINGLAAMALVGLAIFRLVRALLLLRQERNATEATLPAGMPGAVVRLSQCRVIRRPSANRGAGHP